MIEITDRTLDETYRHGIADLVAHMPRPSIDTRQRRVPVLVAIAGIAIPLAALAVAALVVIAAHAQHSVAPAGKAARPNPVAVGQTIGIGATVVPAASVTVQKVTFIAASDATQPSPANGLYAAMEVQVAMPGGGALQSPSAPYSAAAAMVSGLLAQLQTALVDNDAARATVLRTIIAVDEEKLSRDALTLMPFTFEYVAVDGESFAAWGGNSAQANPTATVLPPLPVPGLTSFDVVFDVPSSGGVIQMINPQGRVVGRWQAPAE
jgi:hypothetical protein